MVGTRQKYREKGREERSREMKRHRVDLVKTERGSGKGREDKMGKSRGQQDSRSEGQREGESYSSKRGSK